MKAVCAAAVLLLVSGCGAEAQPDGGTAQGAAEAITDDETAQDVIEAKPDGETESGVTEAEPDGETESGVTEAEPDGETESGVTEAEPDGETESGVTEAKPDDGTARDGGGAKQESRALAGRTLSILGDSISTFRGYNLEGYAVFFPDFGEVAAVEDTWWQRAADDLGLTLYKNGSSSGATVAGDSRGTDDPACACNELRTGALAGPEGACPELIIVYLGTNDMIEAVPLGTNDGTAPVEEGVIAAFSDAYTLMLDKLQAKYPQAEIYCCTLLPVGNYGTNTPFVEWVNGNGLTSADYSSVIAQIAGNKGFSVVDLQDCGVTIENLAEMTTDGVHPKPAGMACIAEAVKKALGAE